MGSKQKRLRLAAGLRFREGKLVPADSIPEVPSRPIYRERLLRCRLCNNTMPEHLALMHVQDCWGIKYWTIGEIPAQPPPEAIAHFRQNHHIGIIGIKK